MKKRIALVVLALLLPLVVVIVVLRVALPGMLPAGAENTTPIATLKIPNTLEDAKSLTSERLAHLESLTQAQWDEERKTIPHKHPPARLEDAIARTRQRIHDLNTLPPELWEDEKKRIQQRMR